LSETLGQMEKEQGKALAAFTDYVDRERARVARIAAHLSPERRQEQLAALASPERRLELLEQWLKSGGGVTSSPVDAAHDPWQEPVRR